MVVQLSQTAKLKDYIYSLACVVWLWVLDVKLNNNKIITETSYLNSQSNLTSYNINVMFRLSCLGQLNDCHFPSQLGTMPQAPMAWKPQETFSIQIYIYKSILTNSNPQSILVCCVHIKSGITCRLGSALFSQGTTCLHPPSGIHQICISAFPFDPPTQSGT